MCILEAVCVSAHQRPRAARRLVRQLECTSTHKCTFSIQTNGTYFEAFTRCVVCGIADLADFC